MVSIYSLVYNMLLKKIHMEVVIMVQKMKLFLKKMTAILLLTVTLSVVIENNSFVKEWPIVECHQETPDLGCADYNS